jgi:hypothetical protein
MRDISIYGPRHVMRRSLVVLLALLAIVSARAGAQTCLGLASFSDGSVRVTGNGWLTNESSSFGAGLGYGRPTSVFGGLAIGSTSNEAVDGSTVELGASVGYQIPLGKTARVQLCPVASFGIGIGPKSTFNSGIDRSNKTASAGIALATSFFASPRLRIVPTGGLAYAYRQDKAENNAGASLFEIADHYALAQVGIGLVLNSSFSVRPSMDIPLGLDGGYPTFGITLGYNFGTSHGAAGRP